MHDYPELEVVYDDNYSAPIMTIEWIYDCTESLGELVLSTN